LYLLVTDAGYLDEPTVVWERLNEIDGDSEYFDENFRPLNASQTRQQTLLLQQQDALRRRQEVLPLPATVPPQATGGVEGQSLPLSETNAGEDRTTSQEDVHSSDEDADYLLALKLQQEEHALANARRSPAQAPSAQAPPPAVAGTTATLPHSPIRYAPREPSEGYDSQPPSQGPHSSSEGDTPYVMNANGDLVLSDAELQAQQEAALYYAQQRQLQQAQAQGKQPHGQTQYAPPHTVPSGSLRQEYNQQRHTGYVPNRGAPPSRGDARRQSNDCNLM
jgi:hypothetical protein